VDLKNLKQNWDSLGREDPMWAILSDPAQRGNKWDDHAFFETGRVHVAEAMERMKAMSVEPHSERALDFGCGLGRLSQALAGYFDKVDGVDIAPSMIEGAREFNRFGDRVAYHLNDNDDLRIFAENSFDFVMSLIVLQHMPNRYKTSYLKEFLRVLKPGGVVMFTVPSHVVLSKPLGLAYALVPNRALNLYRKRHYGYEGVIELHPMRRKEVEATVAVAGARVVSADPEPLAGDCWRSFQYTVEKGGTAEPAA
jgi:ubiquinone/menaquinone biosynthesis C-methylase UbiE